MAETFEAAKAYQRDLAQKSDAEAEAQMTGITFTELSDAEKGSLPRQDGAGVRPGRRRPARKSSKGAAGHQ